MACANGHSARWNVERLAEDFAPETTLEQIAERLVCKVCGAKDGQMTIFPDAGASQARDIEAFNRSSKYER